MKRFILNIYKFSIILFLGTNTFGFSEGTDYMRLETPIKNMDKTLIKVFSYACPICYEDDETAMPVIVKELEGIVEFKPFHIKTQGVYAKEASELYAVLLVKDSENGITYLFDKKSQFNKAKMAYYHAYHNNKERWREGSESFLETGLKASGLSKAEFESLKNDQRVKDILDMWDASYDIVKMQGLYAYIVNGKYIIYEKNIKSTMNLVEIIKEIADK
ncbi:MAG: thiol:disulfide interchange protein [Campylobacteraceae bacterium]|jgi:thiol:disulfide interchange protein DsbA|nr:thiol:disulfide interchange protein [Campylobacteraceae bacterium]